MGSNPVRVTIMILNPFIRIFLLIKKHILLIYEYMFDIIYAEHLIVGWSQTSKLRGGDNMNKKDLLIFSQVLTILLLILLLFVALI